MNVGTFDPRHPSESEPLGFNLYKRLVSGETVSSATFSIEVTDGTDPSPSVVLVGSPIITSSTAAQRISGGVSGCTYMLTCLATTSAGNIHEVCASFSVVDC